MAIYNNITEVFGNTPLVRINKITDGAAGNVYAKLEFYNPTSSIKDRLGIAMIDAAEASGALKPGGTIVEATSGNTGIAVAMVAAARGYKAIMTMPESVSKERRKLIRAYGAELVLTPAAEGMKGAVAAAEKLGESGAVLVRQFENEAGPFIHHSTTGPEIWRDLDGKVDAFVSGIGTGGTITGTAMFLKQMNPNIKIWAIDAYGSLLTHYYNTGLIDMTKVHAYVSEGFGEDFVPENFDMSLIDHFEQVIDKDGAIMARRIAREEGIFCGYSAGSCLQGLMQLKEQLKKDDTVVCIFHDHGSRYVGKIYNDQWMIDQGFMDEATKIAPEIKKVS